MGSSDENSLSQANGRFALSLFKQLAKDKGAEGNIFMSPLSISTAFAMTKLGACNSTLEQIMKKLSGWLNATTETTVAVQIPRFRIEDSFKCSPTSPFSGNAVSGMVANFTKGLYVSEAYHKAFLEVNEEGSEAAGATALAFLGRSLNLNRESFVANRPFLLFIREFTINAIIFAGRVANPCKSS
uniref:Serpin domain-containing protein n=1 Tax=Electrophorus electricus TaxID=8005 RepID=A0A4W4G7G1_ELEEL